MCAYKYRLKLESLLGIRLLIFREKLAIIRLIIEFLYHVRCNIDPNITPTEAKPFHIKFYNVPIIIS